MNKNIGNRETGIHNERIVKTLISAPPIEAGLSVLKTKKELKVASASNN